MEVLHFIALFQYSHYWGIAIRWSANAIYYAQYILCTITNIIINLLTSETVGSDPTVLLVSKF